jgi:hypothetical protein
MIDITSFNETTDDLNTFDTQVPRAGNILSIQIGSLEYEPELGIDLRYFLSEDFRFQNESFRSYLIEILANNGINVASVTEEVENLFQQYTFNLTPEETGGGLVAR